VTKRILLALTLAATLGGAVAACNTPAATTSPLASTTMFGIGIDQPAAYIVQARIPIRWARVWTVAAIMARSPHL
jgi:hypothetical protein